MYEPTKESLLRVASDLCDISDEYDEFIEEHETLLGSTGVPVARSRAASLSAALALLRHYVNECIPISVMERLPEKNGEYQTWHQNTREPGDGLWECPTQFYEGEFWQRDSNGERAYVLTCIAYWRPLPRAPQPDLLVPAPSNGRRDNEIHSQL